MDRVYNILQSILSDTSIFENNKDNETFRDYISSRSIEAIEYNINFFKDIPENEIKEVLQKLLELVFFYEKDIAMYNTDTERIFRSWMPLADVNNFDKSGRKMLERIMRKDKNKPSRLKKNDLDLFKQYQEMIERLFPLQACKPPRLYLEGDKDISILYDINKDLIEDLEEEKFEIISKRNYHKLPAPTKTKIKDFLDRVQKKYSLRGVSIEKKQMKDGIRPIIDKSLPTID